jgi:hypothetical protein
MGLMMDIDATTWTGYVPPRPPPDDRPRREDWPLPRSMTLSLSRRKLIVHVSGAAVALTAFAALLISQPPRQSSLSAVIIVLIGPAVLIRGIASAWSGHIVLRMRPYGLTFRDANEITSWSDIRRAAICWQFWMLGPLSPTTVRIWVGDSKTSRDLPSPLNIGQGELFAQVQAHRAAYGRQT